MLTRKERPSESGLGPGFGESEIPQLGEATKRDPEVRILPTPTVGSWASGLSRQIKNLKVPSVILTEDSVWLASFAGASHKAPDMLISVIFPLADQRPFYTGLAGRLSKPNWSVPDTRDFIRSMGPVRERLLGGGDTFLREGYFCESSRDIRAVSRLGGKDGKRIPGLIGSYKRLYFDGFRLEVEEGAKIAPQEPVGAQEPMDNLSSGGAITGKLEIGLLYGAGAARKAGATDIETILQAALSFPIKPHRRSKDFLPLALIGEPFARFLQERTTSKVAAAMPPPNLVAAGETLSIVHLRKAEKFTLPRRAQRISLPANSRHEIYHFRTEIGGRHVRSWILVDRAPHDLRQGRLLRLYLSRLHVEHQSLRAILRNMSKPGLLGGDNKSRDRLQAYLRGGLRRISAMSKLSSEIAGHEMGEIARYSENLIRPGDESALIDAIEGLALRPNITRSANAYIRGDTNLYINVESGGILAMNTDNSTTNVNQNWGTQGNVQQAGRDAKQSAKTVQGGEPTTVADAVAQLSELLERLKSELPAEDAAQVSKSMGHLRTELETPGAKPDKGVVLGALERIGGFADKVGTYVEPVGKVIGLVRKLLGF